MTVCAVKYCHNTSDKVVKNTGVSFHTIPTDNFMASRWIKILRLSRREECWKPTRTTKICSEHFKQECIYVTNKGYRKLRQDALPTQNLHIHCGAQKTTNVDDTVDFRDQSQPRTPCHASSTLASVREDCRETPLDDCRAEHLPVSGTSKKRKNILDGGQVHEGYYCNVCSEPVQGFRYICVQCPDFDLCGGCEAREEHGEHFVLRVPRTKANDEITSVLEKIRRELCEDDSDSRSIKMEIKEEPAAESDPLTEDTACDADQSVGTESNLQETSTLSREPQTLTTSAAPRKRKRTKSKGNKISAEITSEATLCEHARETLREFWEGANIIKNEDREVDCEVFVHREAMTTQQSVVTSAPGDASCRVLSPARSSPSSASEDQTEIDLRAWNPHYPAGT